MYSIDSCRLRSLVSFDTRVIDLSCFPFFFSLWLTLTVNDACESTMTLWWLLVTFSQSMLPRKRQISYATNLIFDWSAYRSADCWSCYFRDMKAIKAGKWIRNPWNYPGFLRILIECSLRADTSCSVDCGSILEILSASCYWQRESWT